MSDKFTGDVRQVMQEIQIQAWEHGDREVNILHFLIGILAEGCGANHLRDNVVTEAIERLGLNAEELLKLARKELGPENPDKVAKIESVQPVPFVKHELERAAGIAREYGHEYVTTGHILLAMINEPDMNPATDLLRRFGLEYEAVVGAMKNIFSDSRNNWSETDYTVREDDLAPYTGGHAKVEARVDKYYLEGDIETIENLPDGQLHIRFAWLYRSEAKENPDADEMAGNDLISSAWEEVKELDYFATEPSIDGGRSRGKGIQWLGAKGSRGTNHFIHLRPPGYHHNPTREDFASGRMSQ